MLRDRFANMPRRLLVANVRALAEGNIADIFIKTVLLRITVPVGRPTGTVIRSSTVLMKISAILPSANALTLATRRRRGIFANLSLSMMCCF